MGNPPSNSLASSDNKQISILHDEISAIGKRVDNLQSNILAKIQSLVDASPTTPASTGYATVDDAAKAKSPSSGGLSYVSAVTKNLHKTVKTAVAETFRKQRIDERTNATVAIHGLAERGLDYDDLHDMLSQLGCKAKDVGCVRFGRAVKLSDGNKQSNVSSKPRLLKVELQSSFERDDLLVAAKKLKANQNTAFIYISKWLPCEEFQRLKQLWQRYDQLNDKEAALPNRKKPYVVVNSQLKLLSGNGSLSRAKDPTHGKGTNRSGRSNGGSRPAPISGDMLGNMSPSSSKNAVGGSQLAPSS